MTHPQTEARELYERTNALLNATRATLYEAMITHNQLVEKTKEKFSNDDAFDIEEFEIFKTFQDIEDNFSQESISNVWADKASWPLHK